MRTFITVLFLIFSLQSWTKADDIKDFQIEGISIGDSLLDYFTEEEINKSLISDYPNSDKYKRVQFIKHKRLKIYDAMHISYLKNDKNKKIHSLSGMRDYINNIEACLNKKDIILGEIRDLFKDVNIEDRGKRAHSQDKSKKSFTYSVQIKFISNDRVSIACYDWSKKMGFKDHLRISISNKDFVNWINTEAY